jgi:hypothetical protein
MTLFWVLLFWRSDLGSLYLSLLFPPFFLLGALFNGACQGFSIIVVKQKQLAAHSFEHACVVWCMLIFVIVAGEEFV